MRVGLVLAGFDVLVAGLVGLVLVGLVLAEFDVLVGFDVLVAGLVEIVRVGLFVVVICGRDFALVVELWVVDWG